MKHGMEVIDVTVGFNKGKVEFRWIVICNSLINWIENAKMRKFL